MGQHVLSVYGAFFVLAAVLNLIGERRRHGRTEPRAPGEAEAASERRRRMLIKYWTYLAVTAVVLGSAAWHPLAFAGVTAAILLICLDELLQITGGLRRLGLALGALQVTAALVDGGRYFGPCLAFAVFVVLLVPVFGRDGHARAARRTLVGLAYVPFLGAHLLLLTHRDAFFGPVAFFYMVILVSDCMAMLGGQLFGRRRPFAVSPNKTLEGSIVSLASALAIGLLLRDALPGWSLIGVLVIALAIGLAAQLGDLVASSFKRDAGVKDYGTWLPTFGGLLDRFDSFIFAAPVFAFLMSASVQAF